MMNEPRCRDCSAPIRFIEVDSRWVPVDVESEVMLATRYAVDPDLRQYRVRLYVETAGRWRRRTVYPAGLEPIKGKLVDAYRDHRSVCPARRPERPLTSSEAP